MIEELTYEKVNKDRIKPIDWVKHYFPNWSNEKCDFVLWEQTCFPFSAEQALKQIYKIYLKEAKTTSSTSQ